MTTTANADAARSIAVSGADLRDPRSVAAFRATKLLVGGYLGMSVLALVVVALLHGDSSAVNGAVWTRTSVVTVSASVMYTCAVFAARGSRRAYRRLRLMSAAMVVGITAVIAQPGPYPLWLKIEQGLCGLVLIGVAVVVNGRQLRRAFARK